MIELLNGLLEPYGLSAADCGNRDIVLAQRRLYEFERLLRKAVGDFVYRAAIYDPSCGPAADQAITDFATGVNAQISHYGVIGVLRERIIWSLASLLDQERDGHLEEWQPPEGIPETVGAVAMAVIYLLGQEVPEPRFPHLVPRWIGG